MRRAVLLLAVLTAGCESEPAGPSPTATTDGLTAAEDSLLVLRLAQYATAALDPDLEGLSDSMRLALPHLIDAARALDGVFVAQTGSPGSLEFGEAARRYLAINYGPWDRLDGDAPFLPGVDPKPAGAGLYPPDLEEATLLSTADLYPELDLTSRTTLVRREGGSLVGVPYEDAFADEHQAAAAHLRAAAAVVPD
ncbi:MAG: Zn-dependent hydrolase, partial [Rubrivirga sp.]